MIIELHMLQNFAPSCLNRDDTNSPKECEFGGYRRARISSQCIKRAIREDENFAGLLETNGGVRTKKLITQIVKRLNDKGLKDDGIDKTVADVLKEGGLDSTNGNTDILIFLEKSALDEFADIFQKRFAPLVKGDKEAQKLATKELGDVLAQRVKAPDIALFGRMLALKPNTPFGKNSLNVIAACQVAHAISTHKVGVEFDFYTAMDDLKKPEEEPGAGMMGTVEFNSACFYRYANIDCAQLKKNLGDDKELTQKTVEAFIRAAVNAIPTGKQNSFAAQNPPSFVFAVTRSSGTWSLANAFAKPVWVGDNGNLVQKSTDALLAYWDKLVKVYGDDGIKEKIALTLEERDLQELDGDNLEGLIARVNQVIAANC